MRYENLETTRKLPRSFYERDTTAVARDLLGKFLVHREDGKARIGKIVETEAYIGPQDLASHSARGKTRRNAAVFGPIGHAYVYLIYGLYECMNVVTEEEGKGAAILIRALEPIQNCDGRTNGPGLLCKAMAISHVLNGFDLLGDAIYIAKSPGEEQMHIVARPRIGVDYAGRWARRLLRFYIRGNPFVSRP